MPFAPHKAWVPGGPDGDKDEGGHASSYEAIANDFCDNDTPDARLAAIDAVAAAEASQKCPDCDGGWNVETDASGEPIQTQCDTCWGYGYLLPHDDEDALWREDQRVERAMIEGTF